MDYSRFFQKSKRVSGANKPVKIIDPDLFPQFLEEVSKDANLPIEVKAFTLIASSSGGRVSEILNLHKKDFTLNLFDLSVLKKKCLNKQTGKMIRDKKRNRKCRLYPSAVSVIVDILSHRKPQEKLFRIGRNQILYALKRYFGVDIECHSFRHSHVTYLMNRGMTHIKIAKLVDIDVANVTRYAHLNQTKTLEEIF